VWFAPAEPTRDQGYFDESISLTLKRDEAIVLPCYLTRELRKEPASEFCACRRTPSNRAPAGAANTKHDAMINLKRQGLARADEVIE